jgi:protoporphyrin/coproporphyrin ferrochelatase
MPPDAAFLLVSFGGPEGRDDVLPFLRNVTAGRGVPDERLASVAEHYYLFDGVSPINGQNRDLLAAIAKDFAATGIDLPLYWGNRNWQPYLADAMAAMAADGIRRVIAFATAAYSSYSSCRQYLDDLDRARASVESAPEIVKIRPYYRHDGFISSFVGATAEALATLPDQADLVFTAHSIPASMAAASGPAGGAYPAQLAQVAGLVAAAVGRTNWRLAYQSRSGPPAVPWLGPDINECLADLAAAGSPGVCVIPIGFVSDHLEVRYDLDIEAAATAERLGLPMARAATPGTDPRFVSMISALAREYLAAPPAGPCCAGSCCGSGRRG